MRSIALVFVFMTAVAGATPASAQSDRTLSGAAIGAGTGAIVAGPIGAVAGGVIGAVVGGPTVRPARRPVRHCWYNSDGYHRCRYR